jgi:hypothetical protein
VHYTAFFFFARAAREHEDFAHTCYIRSIIGVVKWRGCSILGARKNAWKISVGKPEEAKIFPSISQPKCEDNIKMNLEGVWQERM